MAYQSLSITTAKIGPIFDGRAEIAVEEFMAQLTGEAAVVGRDWIRIDALSMDKSGRGGTGAAAEGVLLNKIPGGWQIFGGMVKGVEWWPWLEGDSVRNQKSAFKGYHTFRKTRFRLNATLPGLAELTLQKYLAEMGGAEL